MRRYDRRRVLSVSGAIVACLAAGGLLAAQGPVTGSRSGSGADSIVLTVADYYGSQSPPLGMAEFAARAYEISKGTILMPLTGLPTGTPSEAEVLQSVASGKYDLGFVGTRSLDQVGVRAFQPLSAPFLIDSYPALTEVVSDPAVTAQLSTLEGTGAVGLALLADELSLPFGLHAAPRTIEDYRGTVMRTDPSDVQTKSLTALGATPVTTPLVVGPDVPFEAYDTTLRRYDESYHQDFARFLTVNTPLWPQTSVILVNRRTLEGLTEQQAAWIHEAAAYAASWSAEHAGDQAADELAVACSAGLRVTTATTEQRVALRAAVEPIYRRMRVDPQLAGLLSRIEELVAAAPREPNPTLPEPCQAPVPAAGKAQQPPARSSPGRTGDLPQGVYRFQHSASDLLARGLPEADAMGNAGVFTWTLEDGEWSYTQLPSFFASVTSCSGYYNVRGDRVDFTTAAMSTQGACAPPTWSARWELLGETLMWPDVTIADFGPAFAGPGWTKIG